MNKPVWNASQEIRCNKGESAFIVHIIWKEILTDLHNSRLESVEESTKLEMDQQIWEHEEDKTDSMTFQWFMRQYVSNVHVLGASKRIECVKYLKTYWQKISRIRNFYRSKNPHESQAG